MYANNIPAPQQSTKVLNDLKKITAGDSVQYKPFNGGQPKLLSITDILLSKTDPTNPRLFLGTQNGKSLRVLENQVMRVVFKSREEYADLKDPEDD